MSARKDINADGQAIQVVGVASDGEQIIAGGIGLITAGPLGALAAWGAIRALAGKWTPWMVLGFVASPVLLGFQLFVLGSLSQKVENLPRPTTESSRIEACKAKNLDFKAFQDCLSK